ncbi:hypothetical protein MRX96_001897 [Rhipicephalus microplus]
MPVAQPVPTPTLHERLVRPGILKSCAGMPDPGRVQPKKTLRFQLEPTAMGKADDGVFSIELTEPPNEAWSTSLSSNATVEKEPPKSSNTPAPPSPPEGSLESEYLTEVTDDQSTDNAEGSILSSSKSHDSESVEVSSAMSLSISGHAGYLRTSKKNKGRNPFEGVRKHASSWIPEEIRQYLARHSWLGDVSFGGRLSGSSLPLSGSSDVEQSSLVEENAAQHVVCKRYAALTLSAGLLMLMVAAVTANIEASMRQSDQGVSLDKDGLLPISMNEESPSVAVAGRRAFYDGGSDEEPTQDEVDGSSTIRPADGHSGTVEDATVVADGGYAIGDIQKITKNWSMNEHRNPAFLMERKVQLPYTNLRVQPIVVSKEHRNSPQAATSMKRVSNASKGAKELLKLSPHLFYDFAGIAGGTSDRGRFTLPRKNRIRPRKNCSPLLRRTTSADADGTRHGQPRKPLQNDEPSRGNHSRVMIKNSATTSSNTTGRVSMASCENTEASPDVATHIFGISLLEGPQSSTDGNDPASGMRRNKDNSTASTLDTLRV